MKKAKKTVASKPKSRMKDLPPKANPRGGTGLVQADGSVVPAVQNTALKILPGVADVTSKISGR